MPDFFSWVNNALASKDKPNVFIYLFKQDMSAEDRTKNSEKCASNLNYEIKIWCLTSNPSAHK